MAALRTINLQDKLVELGGVTIFELRIDWRRLYRMPPPMRLSRDLLIRGIAYKLQERACGGLSKAMLRRLTRHSEDTADDAKGEPTPRITLKPGTRLVREWHGVTHTVLVHRNGFEWRGQHYRSLSGIARTITGAHWSGPRFFGLRRRSANRQFDEVPSDAASTSS